MIGIFMKIVYLCIFHVARRSTFLARITAEENQMTRSRSRKPPCSPSLFVATLLAVHGQYKFSPTCTEQMETSLCGFPAAILPLCDRNKIERDSRRKGREKKEIVFDDVTGRNGVIKATRIAIDVGSREIHAVLAASFNACSVNLLEESFGDKSWRYACGEGASSR